MLQPRYSRLSSLLTTPLSKQALPTGKGFGGSRLDRTHFKELVFPVVSSSVSIADCSPPISIEQSSPLIIEVGKIFLLALWLWCSIGANFCADSINALVASCGSDA
jgi:hypothetical protein